MRARPLGRCTSTSAASRAARLVPPPAPAAPDVAVRAHHVAAGQAAGPDPGPRGAADEAAADQGDRVAARRGRRWAASEETIGCHQPRASAARPSRLRVLPAALCTAKGPHPHPPRSPAPTPPRPRPRRQAVCPGGVGHPRRHGPAVQDGAQVDDAYRQGAGRARPAPRAAVLAVHASWSLRPFSSCHTSRPKPRPNRCSC
jgi:hypothetical protein